MKYLLLAYADEQHIAAMPASELEALGEECEASDQALRESGHLLDVKGLQSPSTATTVRYRSGKASVTDGPFAETKEQLVGIFLIEAGDLNAAINIATQMPQLRGGPIEVRPVMEFDGE